MSKTKIWKAERLEDLAFHGEAERMRFLLKHACKKISAILCLMKENDQLQLINLITNFKGRSLPENFSLALKPENNKKLNSLVKLLHLLNIKDLEVIVKEFSQYHTDGTKLLTNALEGLTNTFDIRFGMNASCAKLHKKHLRRAWLEQTKYKEEIRGLRNELYGLKMAMKARVAAKRRLIREQEDEIMELQRNCRADIAKLCTQTESRMDEACATSQEHQEDLERELVYAQKTLTDLQVEHQQLEKKFRGEKKKTEEFLELIIANYDETMFKLHSEMTGTKQCYLDELEQLKKLQIKFKSQELFYQDAMAEKAREERAEIERQIKLFRQRVAAGKIQKFWKAYMLRKQEKSKGKKGKKGRKKQTKS